MEDGFEGVVPSLEHIDRSNEVNLCKQNTNIVFKFLRNRHEEPTWKHGLCPAGFSLQLQETTHKDRVEGRGPSSFVQIHYLWRVVH